MPAQGYGAYMHHRPYLQRMRWLGPVHLRCVDRVVMRILLAALLLSGCASEAPAHFEAVKASVDSCLAYQHYVAKDYRFVAGEGSGNCAVFATTDMVDAAAQGRAAR